MSHLDQQCNSIDNTLEAKDLTVAKHDLLSESESVSSFPAEDGVGYNYEAKINTSDSLDHNQELDSVMATSPMTPCATRNKTSIMNGDHTATVTTSSITHSDDNASPCKISGTKSSSRPTFSNSDKVKFAKPSPIPMKITARRKQIKIMNPVNGESLLGVDATNLAEEEEEKEEESFPLKLNMNDANEEQEELERNEPYSDNFRESSDSPLRSNQSNDIRVLPPSSPIPTLDSTLPYYARESAIFTNSNKDTHQQQKEINDDLSPLLLNKKRPRTVSSTAPSILSSSLSSSSSSTNPSSVTAIVHCSSQPQLSTPIRELACSNEYSPSLSTPPSPGKHTSSPHRTYASPSAASPNSSMKQSQKRLCFDKGSPQSQCSKEKVHTHSPPHTHSQPHPHSHSPTRSSPKLSPLKSAAIPVDSSQSSLSSSSPSQSPVGMSPLEITSSEVPAIASLKSTLQRTNANDVHQASDFVKATSSTSFTGLEAQKGSTLAQQGGSPPRLSSLGSLPSPNRKREDKLTMLGKVDNKEDEDKISTDMKVQEDGDERMQNHNPSLNSDIREDNDQVRVDSLSLKVFSSPQIKPSNSLGEVEANRGSFTLNSSSLASLPSPSQGQHMNAVVKSPSNQTKTLVSILKRQYPISHPNARIKRVQQREYYAFPPHPVKPRTIPRPADLLGQSNNSQDEKVSKIDNHVGKDSEETDCEGEHDSENTFRVVSNSKTKPTKKKIRFTVCHVAEFPLFPDWSKTPCEDDEYYSIGFAPDPTHVYTVSVDDRTRTHAYDSAGAVRSIPETARAAAWQAIHNQLISMSNDFASACAASLSISATPATTTAVASSGTLSQHPHNSLVPGNSLNLGGFTRAIGLGGMVGRPSYAAAAAAAVSFSSLTTSPQQKQKQQHLQTISLPHQQQHHQQQVQQPRVRHGSPRLRMVLLEMLKDLMEKAGFTQCASWLGRIGIPKYKSLIDQQINSLKNSHSLSQQPKQKQMMQSIPLPPLPSPSTDAIRRSFVQFAKQIPKIDFSDRDDLDALRQRRFEVGCRCQPRTVSGGCRGVSCSCTQIGLMCSGDACECTRPTCSNPWGRHGFNQRRVDIVRRQILRRCRMFEASGEYGCPTFIADQIRSRLYRTQPHTATEPNLIELKRQFGIVVPLIDMSDDEDEDNERHGISHDAQKSANQLNATETKKMIRYRIRKSLMRGGYTLGVSQSDESRLGAVLLSASEQMERNGEGIYTIYDDTLSDLDSDIDDPLVENSDDEVDEENAASQDGEGRDNASESDFVIFDSPKRQLKRLASLLAEETNGFEEYLDKSVNDLEDDGANVENQTSVPNASDSSTLSQSYDGYGNALGLFDQFNNVSELDDEFEQDDQDDQDYEDDGLDFMARTANEFGDFEDDNDVFDDAHGDTHSDTHDNQHQYDDSNRSERLYSQMASNGTDIDQQSSHLKPHGFSLHQPLLNLSKPMTVSPQDMTLYESDQDSNEDDEEHTKHAFNLNRFAAVSGEASGDSLEIDRVEAVQP